MFVGAKWLKVGDVLFIRDEKSQMLLGVQRANRQNSSLPSSLLSADNMHIGVLAAAAHAASNRTPFTLFYNPRYMVNLVMFFDDPKLPIYYHTVLKSIKTNNRSLRRCLITVLVQLCYLLARKGE